MAINAIYQHHERTTNADLEADLQLREIGIDPENKTLVAYSEVLGIKISAFTDESTEVDFSSATVYALHLQAGTILTAGLVSVGGNLVGSSNAFLSGVNLGYWLNTPGTFTYGMYQSGTELRFRSGSASPWLIVTSAGLPTFQNQTTLTGATFSGGTSAQGAIYTTATVGLALQAKAGSSYDLSILGTGGIGSYVMRVPTGTTTAEFPNNVTVGGTLGVTGLTTIGADAASNPGLYVNGSGSTSKEIGFRVAGNYRWIWDVSGSESSGDAGSLIRLRARTDAGAAIDDPITIIRAAGGAMTLARPVTISNLAGTGTRITTSTSTGVQGNATTIAGANTWSDAQTFSSLTSGRIPVAGASGLLTVDNIYWTTGGFLGVGAAAAGNSGWAIQVAKSDSGNKVAIYVANTSNTANSSSKIELSTAGTSGGDAFIHMFRNSGAAANWALGLYNTDGSFALSSTGALSSGVIQKWDSTGATVTGQLGAIISTAGTTNVLQVGNTNNSNAASGAQLRASVGGGSAGDPTLYFLIGSGGTASIGLDNDDSDKFKISMSSGLGTQDALVIDNSTLLATFKAGLSVEGDYFEFPASASAPTGAVRRAYYDTSTGHLRVYTAAGGGWVDIA